MPRSSLASCGTIYPDKEPPMHRITATLERIRPLDQQLLAQTQTRLDNKTKPLGSLGRLEEFACRLVAITGQEQPDLSRKAIFTFAADHGVTEEGSRSNPVRSRPKFSTSCARSRVNAARQPGPRCGCCEGVDQDFENCPAWCTARFPGAPATSARPAMTTTRRQPHLAARPAARARPRGSASGDGELWDRHTTPRRPSSRPSAALRWRGHPSRHRYQRPGPADQDHCHQERA